MTLTAKDVAEISRLLAESNFDELTLELDGLKLSLRRNGAAAPLSPAAPDSAATLPGQPSRPQGASAAEGLRAAEGPPADAPAAVAPASRVVADAATQSVVAPLLGTFYRAPKPGAPPFVEVGSVVVEDTIVGIIEVMKLMNTVRAGMCGTVADLVAKDGALVEYGETLMRVSKGSQP